MQTRRFELKPERPYSLARTASRLIRFSTLVDRIDEKGGYSRCLRLDGRLALLHVRQTAPPSRAVLEVSLRGEGVRAKAVVEEAERVVRRMLGADCKLRAFYSALGNDPFLADSIKAHRGMSLCGGPTLFETIVTSILAQQVNLRFAYSIYETLTRRYGERFAVDGETRLAFPTPERLARVRIETLRGFKLSAAKAGTIHRMARAFARGELEERELEGLSDDEVIERLVAYKGIGRWTAETSLMRGLGRIDVFPAGDLGVVKKLAIEMLGREEVAKEAEMRDFSRRWRPYRSLALIYAYATYYRAPSSRDSG